MQTCVRVPSFPLRPMRKPEELFCDILIIWCQIFHNDPINLVHCCKSLYPHLMGYCVVLPAQAHFPVSCVIQAVPVVSHAYGVYVVYFPITAAYAAFLVHDAEIQVFPYIVRPVYCKIGQRNSVFKGVFQDCINKFPVSTEQEEREK